MAARDPISVLATHEVLNQPPCLEDFNVYETDRALAEGVNREGAAWAEDGLRAYGAEIGSARIIELGHQANRNPPELRQFDRFGRRIDAVDFHPAWHALMDLAVRHRVHAIAWSEDRPGGHVAHAALAYLLTQAESGVGCPMAMTYAGIPVLRQAPELATDWEPKLTASIYDPSFVPPGEKTGLLMGMAMTEKQGGSDLRGNSTRAVPVTGVGSSGEYLLTGHKWFCSAPMSDVFLTLAYTEKGLSCFLVPRWQPDGSRNPFFIQRLKDKLGNRSNASGEIEYSGTWARLVGEEGRGVRTIIEMVQHTRLDCAAAGAGLMRQALTQALHHTAHRTAFQRLLIQQPLMRNVLADLAVESEAATALLLRVARGFDAGVKDETERAFARIAVAVAKFWINKRAPVFTAEAMECLGGAGYVEESMLPRLYREAPVNAIWEGSGNVICLDVLRAIARAEGTIAAFLAELEDARGGDRRLDAAIDRLKDALADEGNLETRARRLTEQMAVTLQGALLVRHAPAAVADAFCATRLDGDWGRTFGSLPTGLAFDDIIERARAVPS